MHDVNLTHDNETFEVPQLVYAAHRPRRNYARDEFINIHMEEIGNVYMALREYLDFYSCQLLQNMDFQAFGAFCYHNSIRTRR